MSDASPPPPTVPPARSPDVDRLLAIDLGLRVGLATFHREDAGWRLLRYRSSHFGSMAALRKGARGVLRDEGWPAWLVLEGDARLAHPWIQACPTSGVHTRVVSAESWRRDLLLPREQRSGARAKEAADREARRHILASGLESPTHLRHDAAEAIVLGVWATLRTNDGKWVARVPAGKRDGQGT